MPTCPALAAPEPTRYSLHVPLDFDAGLSKVGDYVIVDPAPDWVSPYWAVHSYGSDVSVGVDTMTLIFVLNPGIEPASVSVTFHEVGSAPGVFASLTQTISPVGCVNSSAVPKCRVCSEIVFTHPTRAERLEPPPQPTYPLTR
jgi:hypothetical protein